MWKQLVDTPFTNGVFTYGWNTVLRKTTAFYRLIPSQVYSDSSINDLNL